MGDNFRLLSIDWDFFFPRPDFGPNPSVQDLLLYDWGHSELWPDNLSYTIWLNRAAGFIRAHLPLPTVQTPVVQAFWKRFSFSPGARLWVADSHAAILTIDDRCVSHPTSIVNYDAHHDCGYRNSTSDDCGNWLATYHRRRKVPLPRIEVRYPAWHSPSVFRTDAIHPESMRDVRRVIDTGHPDPTPFDAAFIARSGGWSPPWCDPAFAEFVLASPFQPNLVTFLPDLAPSVIRPFDRREAERYVAAIELMMATARPVDPKEPV